MERRIGWLQPSRGPGRVGSVVALPHAQNWLAGEQHGPLGRRLGVSSERRRTFIAWLAGALAGWS